MRNWIQRNLLISAIILMVVLTVDVLFIMEGKNPGYSKCCDSSQPVADHIGDTVVIHYTIAASQLDDVLAERSGCLFVYNHTSYFNDSIYVDDSLAVLDDFSSVTDTLFTYSIHP